MENKRYKDFGLYFWIHVAFIVFAILSPVLIHWGIILAVIALFLLQEPIFGGCVLSIKQFNAKDVSFYKHYFHKMGFNIGYRECRMLSRYVVPSIVLIMTVTWQIILDRKPLI